MHIEICAFALPFDKAFLPAIQPVLPYRPIMIKKIKKLKKIRIHREGTDTLLYGFIVIAAVALLLWRYCDSKLPFWCFAAIM